MTKVEFAKLKAQFARVSASRLEQEAKLEELFEAVERIKREIEIQQAAEAQLQEKLTSAASEL